jgi:8-amino-7-oxononanoate synthase
VLSDELNHASLIDGLRLSRARKVVYGHQDLNQVARLLAAPRPRRTFIVTESVFSMDGDLTPLAELAELADRHGALLIVDEAHATGLYGERHSGRVEETGVRERVLATVHTGGKALGAAGAWVAGSTELRDILLQRARSFVFSTAPLSALLRTALQGHGVDVRSDVSPIVPIVVGANEAALRLQGGLASAGFDARAVRPPTVPPGTARLRAIVRQPVADADLFRFAAEVARLVAQPAP